MPSLGESQLSGLAPAIVAILAGIVLFAAVKLLWGMAQWARKSEHRIGERWGKERVEVANWEGGEGYVRAGGELWRARSQEALAPGDNVKVVRATGLILDVRKAPQEAPGAAPEKQGE